MLWWDCKFTLPQVLSVISSILACCGYSVPWVKALLHPGSQELARSHCMYRTYVGDVSNVSSGCGPDVQDEVVRRALSFNYSIVIKRKFTLSPKSAAVASDIRLANRMAKELASHGIQVQVANSTQDDGVMHTA